MKRVFWMTVVFILLFAAAFYGVQKVQHCPLMGSAAAGKSAYCCAQSGIYRNLSASSEQQNAIALLDREFIKERNRLCMQLCQSRYGLAQLLLQPDITQKELDDKTAEVASIQLAVERAAAAHVLKVRETLTPEQAKKYMEMLYRDVCSQMDGKSCGFSAVEEKE
ncbi:MAG: periplasmic heavy metal sensor [Candidatus Omnitrophica bacterium]|nr:periplasmic heavy metal sensor [Candidatus Omnitrophota bacterium]